MPISVALPHLLALQPVPDVVAVRDAPPGWEALDAADGVGYNRSITFGLRTVQHRCRQNGIFLKVSGAVTDVHR
jgi:hypothetical protein